MTAYHRVLVPVAVAYSNVGRSGTTVGKAVSDGCPDDVEVGTRRDEVCFSISIGSMMTSIDSFNRWMREVMCKWIE